MTYDHQIFIMLTHIGCALDYGDVKQAQRLQSLALEWVENIEHRGLIYDKHFAAPYRETVGASPAPVQQSGPVQAPP